MSTFKGHFSSSLQENHQFFCDENFPDNRNYESSTLTPPGITFPVTISSSDPKESVKLLKTLVLTSFTLDSCYLIFNNSLKYLKSQKGLSNSSFSKIKKGETIIDQAGGSFISGKYTKFNKVDKKYEDSKTSIDFDTIKRLIKYHENRQFDSAFAEDDALENLLKDVNTSLEKGIIIEAKVLNQSDSVCFKLTFFSRSNRSNAREIATPNNAIYAGVPSTPYGLQYSYNKTANFQSDDISNVGSFIPANQKDKFSQNSVAAPLRMHFDPNSNMYEAGTTQMLALLITDVGPADTKDVPQEIIRNKVPADQKEVLEALSPFTTGEAIPLSTQNGNPNTFGPDYIECGDKNLSNIIVVNRSRESYSIGTTVIVSRINNEWLIIGAFGKGVPPVAQVGEWSFVKLIASSDEYFKDAQFEIDGSKPEIITDNYYISEARKVFYSQVNMRALSYIARSIGYTSENFKQIISQNQPSGNIQFNPSKKYMLCSVFDQLPESLGGFADDGLNILYNNNFTLLGEDPILEQNQTVSFFWGPLFTEGYSSFNLVEPNSGNVVFKDPIKKYADYFFKKPTVENRDELLSALRSKFLNPNLTDTTLIPNENLINKFPVIPAEISANILQSKYLFDNWSKMGRRVGLVDYRVGFSMTLGSISGIKNPYYFSAGSNNSIQFTPISLEFVGNAYSKPHPDTREGDIDPFSISELSKGLVKSMSSSQDENFPDNRNEDLSIYGNMSNRSDPIKIKLLCNTKYKNPNEPFSAKGNPNIFQPNLYNYGCGSDGTRSGSNVVGIVSGKTTVLKSGNNINFSVQQKFGSTVNRQVSRGFGPNVTVLPIGAGIGWSTGGQDPSVRSTPTWGSSEDKVHSFGTLALHVKVFDHWPEEQTIFDPRYFSVLHCNPGLIGTWDAAIEGSGVIKTNVDFAMPTKEVKEGDKITRTIISNGDKIDNTTKLSSKPIINTIRRGQLLSGGGFSYIKRVIGFSDSKNITQKGSGFNVGDEIKIAKNAIIVVTSIDGGGLSDFKFKEIDNDSGKYTARGENISPNDFQKTSFNVGNAVFDGFFIMVSITPPNPNNGKSATVAFNSGLVYEQTLKDLPPKEYTNGPARLTSASNRGQGTQASTLAGRFGIETNGIVDGTEETSIGIEKNSTNKYDCFFHFHNDAGLYCLSELNALVQSIILNIT
jgi:hypothetical protein